MSSQEHPLVQVIANADHILFSASPEPNEMLEWAINLRATNPTLFEMFVKGFKEADKRIASKKNS